MTQDQVMATLRQVLPSVGTLLTIFGWATPDQAATLVSETVAFAGPAMVVGSLVWAIIANGKVSILKSAAQMPEVTEIKISTPKGAEPGAASDLAKSVDAPEITVTTRGI